MKKWHIEYWSGTKTKSPIEKWFDELTNEKFKSIAKELAMLEEAGNELKLPHSRALGGGLFEPRERRFGYRIYYGLSGNQLIVLLAAGDKSSQEKDIKIARERLSNV